jgi:hypothetical protein
MFASIDKARTQRRVWLAALLLYAFGAGVDVSHRLTDDSRNRAFEFAEIPVTFSAGLFWPVDLIASALLSMR